MAALTLGLDLGANSIGWALLDPEAGQIVRTGVRVFPEGVDRDTSGAEVSKNEQRRMARAIRRQIRRRARRRRQLRLALTKARLLPAIAALPANHPNRVEWEKAEFKKADPYSLRRRALTEKLEPYEIGRALFHLGQRRGFLSNRKTDRERKKENSEILAEMSQLAADMGNATLGQHLDGLRGEDAQRFNLTRLRGRHTRRDMYQAEFDRIWKSQQVHHPDLLTDQLKYGSHGKAEYPRQPLPRDSNKDVLDQFGLYGLLFFQRPILSPSPALVGRCEVEPRLARCPRGDRRAQRIRLFQEVNNLTCIDISTGEELSFRDPANIDLREKLIRYLSSSKERKFDAIRKHLFDEYENVRFNLERGGRNKLHGLPSDAAIGHKKLLGKAWKRIPERDKDWIVAAIIDDDEPRLRQMLEENGIDANRAPDLLDNVDLESGYSSYSLHAIKELLPHVERGLPLTSRDANTPCALREAGYLMPWERAAEQQPFLPEPPDVTNPLVRTALHEVRRVINALLRELVYASGHILTSIHIEMAREVRGTAKQRAQRSKEMRQRERSRDAAADFIREYGLKPTREAIDRYLLWKEQGERCIYSGRMVSPEQLFGGEIAIDHILPRQRSLDNSLMNKVVCFRDENDKKGDRTPYEWLAKLNTERYENVLQRARSLPRECYPKLKRFYQQGVELEDFFARQFVDTTYITTQVHDYVHCLGADVVCPKGQHTATLRRLWGVETVLGDLKDSPAWQAATDLAAGEKNRLDHRHHAIDAIVIALTNRSRLQQLAILLSSNDPHATLREPWKHFRATVEGVIREIYVSHRVRRKASGPLHRDTVYGPGDTSAEFVYRKPLESLTPTMVRNIRDQVVRDLIIARLKMFGIDAKRGAGKIPAEVWKEPLYMKTKDHSLKIPIRKVRLAIPSESIRSIRNGNAFVELGNTHHVCIFEVDTPDGKKSKEVIFVSMLEARQRVRRREAIIQRTHRENPTARFLFSLSGNELVELEHNDTQEIYRFEKGASTSGQLWFRHHAAGGKSSEKIGQVSKKPSTFVARKVTVDPLGRIRWAND